MWVETIEMMRRMWIEVMRVKSQTHYQEKAPIYIFLISRLGFEARTRSVGSFVLLTPQEHCLLDRHKRCHLASFTAIMFACTESTRTGNTTCQLELFEILKLVRVRLGIHLRAHLTAGRYSGNSRQQDIRLPRLGSSQVCLPSCN